MNVCHFDTAIGKCSLYFERGRVRGLRLPADRYTIRGKAPGKDGPSTKFPGHVSEWTRVISAYLSGHGSASRLRRIPIDYTGLSPFSIKVYKELRKLDRGGLTTYGELARRIGCPRAARAVGRALAGNPFPILVPCHKVLAAHGNELGGFSGPGGPAQKLAILAAEGIQLGARALGLRFSPEKACSHLSKVSGKFKKLIRLAGPLRLLVDPMESPYHALFKAIVYQQLTGKAAATILKRVKGLYDGLFPEPERLLSTPVEKLRAAGLSGNKSAALMDLAGKTLDGTVVPLDEMNSLSDAELLERLTTIRGIGEWSVQMLLIFRLGRPDVLPACDLGVRKGLARLEGLEGPPSPKEVIELGRRWAPFRTAASWYLWRAVELPGEIVL